MSTYNYKPGLGLVGAYQVSGIPYVTGAINCAQGTLQKIEFPSVTKNFTIFNADSNDPVNEVKVSFSPNGVANNAYFSVFGTPVTLDVKVTELYLTGSDEVSVVAALTSIETININNSSISPSGSNWSGSLNANVG